MNIFFYLVLGIILFMIFYRFVFDRNSFKIIKRIMAITGYRKNLVHKFIMYDLLDSIGKESWGKFTKIIVTEGHIENVLVPAFLGWIATREPQGTELQKIDEKMASEKAKELGFSIDDINRINTEVFTFIVARAKIESRS